MTVSSGLGTNSRRRPTRSIALLGLSLVAFFVLLTAWSFASPVGSSPDDDFHLTSIWCANSNSELCRPGETADSRQVSSRLTAIYCFAHQPKVPADCQTQALNGVDSFQQTKRGNFQSEYPTGFYSVLSRFATDDVTSSVWNMRMFNIGIFISFLVGCLVVLRRTSQHLFLWMWIILASPLALFLVPSTNPSSWAVSGVGMGWVFLLTAVRETGWRRQLAVVAYLLSICLVAAARADAAVFSALLAAFVIAMWWGSVSSRSLAAALAGATLAVAAFTVMTTTQLTGATSSGLIDQDVTVQSQASGLGLLGFNIIQLPEYFAGMFGLTGLGWTDTEMPAIVWVSGTVIAGAIGFLLLRSLSAQQKLFTAVFVAGICIIALYMFQTAHAHVGAIVQPRYLYPLVIAAFGIVWLKGVENSDSTPTRTQYRIVALTFFVSSSVALFVNISRYVQGQSNGFSLNLDTQLPEIGSWWFSSVSPNWTWLLGAVAGLIIISLVLKLNPQGPPSASNTFAGPPSLGIKSVAPGVTDKVE